MKYIVVDLEMNPIQSKLKQERKICKNEIIQIGAVCLNEDYDEIAEFKTYVCPQINPVVINRIRKLTHITTEMVQGAPDFQRAMAMFFEWCGSFEGEVQIFQWSKNDYDQIRKEMILKHYELCGREAEFMKEEWMDLQDEFDRLTGFKRVQSLSTALNLMCCDFRGKQHDALDDARNEAMLLKELRTSGEIRLAEIAKAMEETTFTFTLADVLDLSGLKLSA